MKRLATILLGLMLTSCSIGYYDSGVLLATTANISVQPAWGPAGYDCAHYYYFPDYNFYYDVNRALFYYHHGNRWLSARQLPYHLGYPRDLYKFYKVVLNIRDPWNYNRQHRTRYKMYKGVRTQPTIVDIKGGRTPQNSYSPRRIPTNQPQAAPPARNNNTQRGYGQATPPAYNRPQSGANNAQRPTATGQGSRRNDQQSQGSTVRPQQQGSSAANRGTGSTSSRGNSSSNSSTGSRSNGSRGR